MYQRSEVCCSSFIWNLYCLELNRPVRKLDKRRERKVNKGFTVQLISKLTLACYRVGQHTCVLVFLSSYSDQTHMWYESYLSCRTHELHFMLCTRSTFMCCMIVRSTQVILVCCIQVNCHPLPEKNQGIQWNGTLTKLVSLSQTTFFHFSLG